jgi:hypothetical protein
MVEEEPKKDKHVMGQDKPELKTIHNSSYANVLGVICNMNCVRSRNDHLEKNKRKTRIV